MPCYKSLEQLIIINLFREFLNALLQKHGAVLQRRVHHNEVRIRLVLVAISTIEVGADLAHIRLRQGQTQRYELLHVLHCVRPGRRYVHHRVVIKGREICASIITATATVCLVHTQCDILHHFHHDVETALSRDSTSPSSRRDSAVRRNDLPLFYPSAASRRSRYTTGSPPCTGSRTPHESRYSPC